MPKRSPSPPAATGGILENDKNKGGRASKAKKSRSTNSNGDSKSGSAGRMLSRAAALDHLPSQAAKDLFSAFVDANRCERRPALVFLWHTARVSLFLAAATTAEVDIPPPFALPHPLTAEAFTQSLLVHFAATVPALSAPQFDAAFACSLPQFVDLLSAANHLCAHPCCVAVAHRGGFEACLPLATVVTTVPRSTMLKCVPRPITANNPHIAPLW